MFTYQEVSNDFTNQLKLGISKLSLEIAKHQYFQEKALDRGALKDSEDLEVKIQWKQALLQSARITLAIVEGRLFSDGEEKRTDSERTD